MTRVPMRCMGRDSLTSVAELPSMPCSLKHAWRLKDVSEICSVRRIDHSENTDRAAMAPHPRTNANSMRALARRLDPCPRPTTGPPGQGAAPPAAASTATTVCDTDSWHVGCGRWLISWARTSNAPT